MRPEIDIEAVAVSTAGATTEVLGALEHGDRQAGAGEGCGGGKAGETTTDDEMTTSVHATETIDGGVL